MNVAVVERVRQVAQAVLRGLGHQAPPWEVLRVGWMPQEGAGLEPGSTSINLHSAHSAMPPDLPALAEHSQLLVDLGTSDDAVRGTTVGAYFPLYVPFAEAVAAFASQIQDHAMEAEATFGRPLPPCPGHTHPLTANVTGGIAVWECPTSPAHHQEPVLPGQPT